MKQKIKNFYKYVIASAVAWALPAIVSAQFGGTSGGGVTSGLSKIRNLFPTQGLAKPDQTLIGFLAEVIKLLLTVAGVIAVLFVILGGFWYLTAGGSKDQAEKGKKTLINAIIGVVVIILSYVIISVVIHTVSSSTP